MKPITTFLSMALLMAAIFSGFSQLVPSSISTLQLSANKTLVTVSVGTNSVVYNVSTNQIVTMESSAGAGYLTVTTISGALINFNLQDSNGHLTFSKGAEQVLIGLQNISFTGAGFGQVGYVTFTVETPSTNSGSFTPANSVVIPSDANGPVQIVLESSSDLVNWVASQPGTYGSTYTNRFFRVRAIAQQP